MSMTHHNKNVTKNAKGKLNGSQLTTRIHQEQKSRRSGSELAH